ncbi:MAG: ABC transporter ATP-binding protein, partial [Candidatus Cloacimonetes bacterium]|nr:ABC transporter ATP-binding protein [Candidatus Cloacimonadota bacterium]
GDFALSGVSALAFYASYGYVVWQTILRRFTIGDLTLYHRAFQNALSNLTHLLSRLSDVYEHNLYLEDLFEFLATQPKIVNREKTIKMPISIQKGIEFRNVSFKYPDAKKYALEDINLFINPNESIALVGRNGAGKTTLVKLLTRLYEPTKGEILIDGIDYREIDISELRRAMGVIFQDFVAYQNKARENIGFGDIRRLQKLTEIIKAAKKSGADKVIESLPEKYDTLLGKQFEGGHELSWGEWQKIALARGFFRDAQILILDEPTASLDAEAEYNLYKKFAQLAKDRVVVLISHRFSTVRVAEKIYVLDKGKLIEQGTHQQLIKQKGEYARLFTMQAEGYK